MESLPVFGNSYVYSFFQHTFPGKHSSGAVMRADIVQKVHPTAKGPISSRVTENIFGEVEMVELIHEKKENLESVKPSLMQVFLPPKNTLSNFHAPALYSEVLLKMAYSQLFPNSCLSLLFLLKDLSHCNSVSHFYVTEICKNTKFKMILPYSLV